MNDDNLYEIDNFSYPYTAINRSCIVRERILAAIIRFQHIRLPRRLRVPAAILEDLLIR
jgi:hypothetical protein